MAVLVWVSMATALWHFTIFVPDRFAGGMVGAFLYANGVAVLVGLASTGFSRPTLADVGWSTPQSAASVASWDWPSPTRTGRRPAAAMTRSDWRRPRDVQLGSNRYRHGPG
jgi:hypothetical protein